MLNTLVTIAKEAGQFMVGDADRTAHTKTGARDIVTVADIQSQNLITSRLQQQFKGEKIVSEELTPEQQKAVFAADFTGFVIDPIDGTYNFKRDMRESAISIGYIKNGQPQVGVVYDPYKQEVFTAEAGKGAFRNGRPIHVSDQSDIAGASIATSNSYDDKAMERNLKRHLAIYERSGNMPWTSCPGSGVLIMAYVACGRFDIYHHNGLKPWDNPAAFLLIREAGGKVLTLTGEEAQFTSNTILAGNPQLVARLQRVFASVNPMLLQ